MRRITVAAVLAALIVPASGSALTTPRLSWHDAHAAVIIAANQIMAGFTEKTHPVRYRCHRHAANVIICRVRVAGDRAKISFKTRVVGRPSSIFVYNSDLRAF